jgi:hypothetical protein
MTSEQEWTRLFEDIAKLQKAQAALPKDTPYYWVVPDDPMGIKCAATLAAIAELDLKRR